MKIIRGNKAYVQKIDIEFLRYTMHSLPDNIFNKIIMDDFNKYDFIPFSATEDIEYFKNHSWIIDYKDIENLSHNDLKEKADTLAKDLENFTAIMYQTKDNEEYKSALKAVKILRHTLTTIGDIDDYKSGRLQFNIPKKENKLRSLLNTVKRKS